MPICRVVRFYLARLIIDSNRWLLISYKQLLHLAHVFASNIYGTITRFGYERMVLLILMIIWMKLLLIQILMLLVIMIYLLVN